MSKKTILALSFMFTLIAGVGYVWSNKSHSLSVNINDEREAVYQNQQIVSLGIVDEHPSEKVDSEVSADLAIDQEDRVHVIWKNKDGFYYTANEPGAMKWKPPIDLPVSDRTVLDPRIISVGEQLHVLYGTNLKHLIGTSLETDQVSWKAVESIATENAIVHKFDVTQKSQRIVIAALESSRTENTTLNVLVGDSVGKSFYKKTIFQLLPDQKKAPFAKPSVLVTDDKIHIIWASTEERLPAKEQIQGLLYNPISFLYHFYSSDFGQTWKEEKIDISDTSKGAIITDLKILQSSGNLNIYYIAQGTIYTMQSADTTGTNWNAPRTLITGNAVNLMTGISGLQSKLLWVDDRYHAQEWWGKIPLIQVIAWDTSPDWQNNDVFLSIANTNAADRKRLTSSLSYTNGLWAASAHDGTFYVLRAGRSKVGKGLNAFGAKPELYLHKIFSTQ